ncbi:hypothetical protein DFP72DRAFT_889465 [Ephemerocybe angulata]|uniref:Uncharacterized protein n=1 Tax=Ephemerocybe angulata TaxID=980116 RepID=A0A8H6I3E9_9AGAR|nr:hypothetical protein DFP72DRAFT_889465 [Tulosesus angulatus]
MCHPYSGPASLECVNENAVTKQFSPRPVLNYSLPSGMASTSYLPRTQQTPSIISASPSDHTLSPVVEESSFFLDHEYDTLDARPSRAHSVRSRRLKKKAPHPPPSAHSAKSDITEFSNVETYRSGWTSSMMSDDTFDYLNDPYLPHWRKVIRRHLRRFRAFLSGPSGIRWTPARSSAISVR